MIYQAKAGIPPPPIKYYGKSGGSLAPLVLHQYPFESYEMLRDSIRAACDARVWYRVDIPSKYLVPVNGAIAIG